MGGNAGRGSARGITTSKRPRSVVDGKGSPAHLAGIEAAFGGIIRRYIGGDPNPIGILKTRMAARPHAKKS
jgi:hypothetical protein